MTLSGTGHIIPPINSVGPSRLVRAYSVARSRVLLDNPFHRFQLSRFHLHTGSLNGTDSGIGSLYFHQLSGTGSKHLLLKYWLIIQQTKYGTFLAKIEKTSKSQSHHIVHLL